MRYPNAPPATEPTEQMSAYLNAFAGILIAKAISRTSGGIGKKDDSVKAKINNATAPYGLCAHLSTQSYNRLTNV